MPIVAIIGQTNAGKSALFNRIVGSQDAIVAREAGTTRDSVVRTVDGKKPFILVDTAGMKTPEDDFEATIQDQIEDAIASADLILLVKDITETATQSDRDIAKKALKSKKPVLLALNKTDLKGKFSRDEFLRLGIRDIYETSAEHNRGVKDLVEAITGQIPAVRTSKESDSIKIALIGRPNVGKSHLFNTLANKQQAIVANVAGTTRDINRISVKYHNQQIELLDTAGVRRKGKIEQGIEKFSILRTVAAIEESDICLLLMDVNELNTGVDQSLAGMITEAGKGIIIVVTKWDTANQVVGWSGSRVVNRKETTVEAGESTDTPEKPVYQSERQFSDEVLAQIGHEFNFIPYAPAIFTSSVTGKNVAKIFDLATEIDARRKTEIPTRKLNDLLQHAVMNHPPAGLKSTHPKFRYMVQTDISPPWFVIYGANFKHIHWSYKRYLERQMREKFDLIGTPIMFSFRDEKQIKANREKKIEN